MNLKLLNAFEKEFGTPLSRISEKKFLDIFSQKDLGRKYFANSKNTEEILNFISENANLKNFSNIMIMKAKIYKSESDIDSIFSKYKEDNIRDSLKESCISMITSENSIDCVSSSLCTMIALEDVDISIYYNNVSNSVNSLFKQISTMNIERISYSLHCDILDLLIQLQFYWNSRYEKKIEIDGLDNHLSRLHEFEYTVLESGRNPSIDIDPEELELLDITKLKKKGD